MTDPKLSQPGTVGLTRYSLLNRGGLIGLVADEANFAKENPGQYYLVSDVAALLSAKDAELQSAIQRWDDEHELHKQNVYGLQAKLSAAEAELARVREASRERELELEGPLSRNLDILVACLKFTSHRLDCSASRGSESDCTCLRGAIRDAIKTSRTALSTDGGAQR